MTRSLQSLVKSAAARRHARALVLAALLLPTTASAGKVVITPLLADETINPKQRLGVFQLIASELDFSPEVEGVVELTEPPATLNDACLANPRCLGTIATSNGGEQVVTGRMSGGAGTFVLDLLFFDGTQIRRKQYNVASDPTALANAITPIVRELLTGSAPGAAKPAVAATNFSADEDDLAVGGGAAMADLLVDAPAPVAPPPPRPAPVVAPPPAPAPRVAAPPPAPPLDADAARRLALASAATGMVTAPAPAVQPSDADLASMISFGGSAADISAEEIDQMIKFGAPPGIAATVAPAPEPVAVVAPAPRASAGVDTSLAEEDAELAALQGNGIADLDGDGSRKAERAPTSSRSTATAPKPAPAGEGELGHVVQLTLRGGYSKYYSFDFITVGGEAGVAVFEGLHLVAGVEAYAVNRVLPPALQQIEGLYSKWDYIFPINFGAIYKFPLGIAQPYVGADTIFVQYYSDNVGADWAAGARFRAGVDLMIIPNVGFNVNVAAGGWFGQNWQYIETGLGSAGFLPQVSGGPVVAF